MYYSDGVVNTAGHSCSSKQFINFQSSSDIPEKCNTARPLRRPTYVAKIISFVDLANLMTLGTLVWHAVIYICIGWYLSPKFFTLWYYILIA
jgi:hypothetical protein